MLPPAIRRVAVARGRGELEVQGATVLPDRLRTAAGAQRAEQGTRGIHAQLARGRYRALVGSTAAWAESRFAGSPAKVGQWGKTSEKVKIGNGAVVVVVEID